MTGRGRHFRSLFEVSLCPEAGAELITGHHASSQPGPNEDLSDVPESSVLSTAFGRERINLLKHEKRVGVSLVLVFVLIIYGFRGCVW